MLYNRPDARKKIIESKIYIRNDSFVNLANLETLVIHVVKNDFEHRAFIGLDRLQVLDISNSTGIFNRELKGMLAPQRMPNLRSLSMQKLGVGQPDINLDEYFWNMVNTRPILYIDLSYVQAALVDFHSLLTYCDKIETYVMRNLVTGLSKNGRTRTPCKTLKTVDISGIITSGLNLCVFDLTINNMHNITCSIDDLSSFGNAETIILDDLCKASLGKRRLENVTGVRVESNICFISKSYL